MNRLVISRSDNTDPFKQNLPNLRDGRATSRSGIVLLLPGTMHLIATWTYESDPEHSFWCDKPGDGHDDHGQGGLDDSKYQPDDESGEPDQFYKSVHGLLQWLCLEDELLGRSTRHAR
jgi:hypothetical protein